MENQKELLEKYIQTMDAKQYKGYQIAKSHLKESFQLEKSVGFLQWVKQNQNTPSNPSTSS